MTETETSPNTAAEAPASPAVELPWADVHTEHHKMLRLAPLKTDRATGVRPLRFVEFSYVERHSKERSLLRMSIQLPNQRVRKEQNHLDVWADHVEKRLFFSRTTCKSSRPTVASAVSWRPRASPGPRNAGRPTG